MKYAVVGLLLLTGLTMTNLQVSAEDDSELSAFPDVVIKEEVNWPGFYLPDLNGKPLSVQDYRGQKVVLHIFASW